MSDDLLNVRFAPKADIQLLRNIRRFGRRRDIVTIRWLLFGDLAFT
jgi:hypothetical protein